METHKELVLKILDRELSGAKDELFRYRLAHKKNSVSPSDRAVFMPGESRLRLAANVLKAEESVRDLEAAIYQLKVLYGLKENE